MPQQRPSGTVGGCQGDARVAGATQPEPALICRDGIDGELCTGMLCVVEAHDGRILLVAVG
jgi:hypothetical protein